MIDFSPNFEHGIFLFYHNLNPLGIPIPKIYAPNPDFFFLFDSLLAHRAIHILLYLISRILSKNVVLRFAFVTKTFYIK